MGKVIKGMEAALDDK